MFDFLLILFFFVFLIPKWACDATGKRIKRDERKKMLDDAYGWERTVTDSDIERWAGEVAKSDKKFSEYHDDVMEALRNLPYTEREIFGSGRNLAKEHIRKIILMGLKGYLPRDIALNGVGTGYFSYGDSVSAYATPEELALRSYPMVKWLTRMVNERHMLSAVVYIFPYGSKDVSRLCVDNAKVPGLYVWDPTLEYNKNRLHKNSY